MTGLIAICIELCLAYFQPGVVLFRRKYCISPGIYGRRSGKRESVPDNGGHALAGFCTGHPGRLSEFEFTEPIPEKMQVLVYYTENSGQEFNRFRRIERWLLRGTTKGIIPLPDVRCEKLRLTLTGAGQIKNVSVNERPAAGPAVRQMLDRVNPLRLLRLRRSAVIFCLHGAERRKRAKQSHGRAAGQPGSGGRERLIWMVCVFLRHCL